VIFGRLSTQNDRRAPFSATLFFSTSYFSPFFALLEAPQVLHERVENTPLWQCGKPFRGANSGEAIFHNREEFEALNQLFFHIFCGELPV